MHKIPTTNEVIIRRFSQNSVGLISSVSESES